MDISNLKKALGPDAITTLKPDKYFLSQFALGRQSLKMEPENITIDRPVLMRLGVNIELSKDVYPPDNPGEYDPEYHRRRVKNLLLSTQEARWPLRVDNEELRPMIIIAKQFNVIEEMVLEEVNKFRIAAGNEPLKVIPTFGTPEFEDYLGQPLVQRAILAAFNEIELERLIRRKNEANKNLDDPLERNRHAFLNLTQQFFKEWYRDNGMQIPFEKIGQLVPKKFKKDEYLEYFKKFLNDPSADPEEVKRILWDIGYWKNPSLYLSWACERTTMTRAELRKKPGFSWIPHKGSSIQEAK